MNFGAIASLIFVLHQLPGPSSGASCNSVKLQGGYLPAQANRIGVVFSFSSKDAGDSPIFSRQIGNGSLEYIFCHQPDPNPRAYGSVWVVGPYFERRGAALVKQTGEWKRCGYNPTSDNRIWEAYDGQKFIAQPDITTVCVDDPKYGTETCKMVELTGDHTRFGVNYTSTGKLERGKPVFSGNHEFIYACADSSYSRWCIGPTVGGPEVKMFVGSIAQHPAEVKGTWYTKEGATFRSVPQVVVRCVGDESNTKTGWSTKRTAVTAGSTVGSGVALVVFGCCLYICFCSDDKVESSNQHVVVYDRRRY